MSASNRLIGFTPEGASANRGKNDSVKTKLRDQFPGLVFIWCIAHWLELALSDALSRTGFTDVN